MVGKWPSTARPGKLFILRILDRVLDQAVGQLATLKHGGFRILPI